MWTRMREHLAASGADPADCLYVCGAFHAASRVEQFGIDSAADAVRHQPAHRHAWLYGLIPSSHSAIEAQFGLASGSVSIAAATWAKALKRSRVTPFRLRGPEGSAEEGRPHSPRRRRRRRSPTGCPGSWPAPPALDAARRGRAARLVRRHRPAGPPQRLPGQHGRRDRGLRDVDPARRACGPAPRPTPYDFQDAAVTCIEKDVVPGRRDVRRLCEILLGGDRIGQVGYEALPPLARDVLRPARAARPGPGEAHASSGRCSTWSASPELVPCSHLLWILRRLLPDGAVRPIMGVAAARRAVDPGELGPRDRPQPAVAGRARVRGRHRRAGAGAAAAACGVGPRAPRRPSPSTRSRTPSCTSAGGRFADELGARAVELLAAERTVDDAPEVLRRIRRLLAHYRATEPALPRWCEAFVTAGYAHYCTLLPTRVHGRGDRRPPGRGDARVPVRHGEPRAVPRLRPRPAGAGRTPVASRGAGQGGAAVGGELAARPADARRAAVPVRRPARQPARRAGGARSTSAGSCRRWSPSRRWRRSWSR